MSDRAGSYLACGDGQAAGGPVRIRVSRCCVAVPLFVALSFTATPRAEGSYRCVHKCGGGTTTALVTYEGGFVFVEGFGDAILQASAVGTGRCDTITTERGQVLFLSVKGQELVYGVYAKGRLIAKSRSLRSGLQLREYTHSFTPEGAEINAVSHSCIAVSTVAKVVIRSMFGDSVLATYNKADTVEDLTDVALGSQEGTYVSYGKSGRRYGILHFGSTGQRFTPLATGAAVRGENCRNSLCLHKGIVYVSTVLDQQTEVVRYDAGSGARMPGSAKIPMGAMLLSVSDASLGFASVDRLCLASRDSVAQWH